MIIPRFMEKVFVDENTGCWRWTAAKNGYGAGRFYDGEKLVQAHRYSYEQLRGPIPDELQPDHLCRHRDCVNPWHIELVTCAENLARGFTIAKMRAAMEECIHGHGFTPENTYIKPNGARHCRACRRETDRRRTPRNRRK